MTDEWEIRLEERRRCIKICQNVLHIERQQLIKAIADLKTADPSHNTALDQVIAIIQQAEETTANR